MDIQFDFVREGCLAFEHFNCGIGGMFIELVIARISLGNKVKNRSQKDKIRGKIFPKAETRVYRE